MFIRFLLLRGQNGKNELKKHGTKAAKQTGEDKKHLKVSKRRRLEVDVENK